MDNITSIKIIMVGLYCGMVCAFFGAVILDINYVNILASLPELRSPGLVYNEISDLLLFISIVTVVCGLIATGLIWDSVKARNFFIASVAVMILVLVIPLVFGETIAKLNIGHWFRVLAGSTATTLVLSGTASFYSRMDPV